MIFPERSCSIGANILIPILFVTARMYVLQALLWKSCPGPVREAIFYFV